MKICPNRSIEEFCAFWLVSLMFIIISIQRGPLVLAQLHFLFIFISAFISLRFQLAPLRSFAIYFSKSSHKFYANSYFLPSYNWWSYFPTLFHWQSSHKFQPLIMRVLEDGSKGLRISSIFANWNCLAGKLREWGSVGLGVRLWEVNFGTGAMKVGPRGQVWFKAGWGDQEWLRSLSPNLCCGDRFVLWSRFGQNKMAVKYH